MELIPVYENRYSEFLDSENTLVAADAYRTVEKTKDGRFLQKIYNPDKMIQSHEIYCSNKEATVKDGKYTEWYDNTKLWMQGQYVNNKKKGFWKIYSDKGYVVLSGNYKNNLRDGIWIEQDSLGRKQTEINYSAGKRNGETRLFNSDGENYETLHFQDGQFLKRDVLIEDKFEGKLEYAASEEPTLLSCAKIKGQSERIRCRNSKFAKVISENVSYPENNRLENIEGKAIIGFRVNKDGKMEDIRVLRGVTADMEKETLRVINLIEDWEPVYLKGKPVVSYFNFPIRYKLN